MFRVVELKCSENPSLDYYIEMFGNKDKINKFFIFRLKCSLQSLNKTKTSENIKNSTNVVIRMLTLSYRVGGENITDIMKNEEKKDFQEKINNSDFNVVNEWNDNIFKYAIKRLLNLGIFCVIRALGRPES